MPKNLPPIVKRYKKKQKLNVYTVENVEACLRI